MTLAEVIQKCAPVKADLESYLVSPDGNDARKRIATNSVEREFTGLDGITRKVISAPLGAFWTVPNALAERLEKAVKAYASLRQGKYFPFKLAGKDFEIGAVSLNKLTKSFEIWFAKAGLLGAQTVSTDELLTQLDGQTVKRTVIPIDTSAMKPAVNTGDGKAVADAVYGAPAGQTTDDDLPF